MASRKAESWFAGGRRIPDGFKRGADSKELEIMPSVGLSSG